MVDLRPVQRLPSPELAGTPRRLVLDDTVHSHWQTLVLVGMWQMLALVGVKMVAIALV